MAWRMSLVIALLTFTRARAADFVNSQILGVKAAGGLPFASTLCGACNDICPVKIPITEILLHLRHRVVEGDEQEKAAAPSTLRMGARLGSIALRSPWLYQLGSTLLRWFQAPLKHDGWLPKLPPPLNRWTMVRPLPAFASDFRTWWRTRSRQGQSPSRRD